MKESLTVNCVVHFQRAARGRKQVTLGEEPVAPPPGRVPRVVRLMALAIRFDRLLRDGVIADIGALAQLGQVTRARISQILSLVYLAPDLQEALLFLPRTQRGRAPVVLRDVLPITMEPDWRKQRTLWRRLPGIRDGV
jgi:hypothetical protein